MSYVAAGQVRSNSLITFPHQKTKLLYTASFHREVHAKETLGMNVVIAMTSHGDMSGRENIKSNYLLNAVYN